MRFALLAILTIVAAIINNAVLADFAILKASPDLILFIVVFYASHSDPEKGLIYGLAAGFFEDLACGAFIGMNALAKGVAGYVVGRAQSGFYEDNLLYGLVNVAIGSLVNAAIILLINLLSSHLIIDRGLLESLASQFLQNVVIAVPVYAVFMVVRTRSWVKSIWGEL